MKKRFEIFLDTDVFLDVLKGKTSFTTSPLKKCIDSFDVCYTSVVNASEIFAEHTQDKVRRLFQDIAILGIPFRYSVKTGEVMRAVKKKEQETVFAMHWL